MGIIPRSGTDEWRLEDETVAARPTWLRVEHENPTGRERAFGQPHEFPGRAEISRDDDERTGSIDSGETIGDDLLADGAHGGDGPLLRLRRTTAGPGAASELTAARFRTVQKRSQPRAVGESRSQTQSQWRETMSPGRRSSVKPTPSRLRRTRSTRWGPRIRRDPSKARPRLVTATMSPSVSSIRPHRIRHLSSTSIGGPSMPARRSPSHG